MRRQEITPDLIDTITGQVEKEAAWPQVVARQLGIHKSVYTRWMDAGEDHHLKDRYAQDDPLDAEAHRQYLYRVLYESIAEAEAQAETNLIHALHVHAEAGKTTWNAFMNMLERRFPDRWRKKDAVMGPGGTIEQQLADFMKRGTSTSAS